MQPITQANTNPALWIVMSINKNLDRPRNVGINLLFFNLKTLYHRKNINARMNNNDPPPPYTSRPPSYTERAPLLDIHLPTEPRPYRSPAPRPEDGSRFRTATCMSVLVVLLVLGFYLILFTIVVLSVFWPRLGPW